MSQEVQFGDEPEHRGQRAAGWLFALSLLCALVAWVCAERISPNASRHLAGRDPQQAANVAAMAAIVTGLLGLACRPRRLGCLAIVLALVAQVHCIWCAAR